MLQRRFLALALLAVLFPTAPAALAAEAKAKAKAAWAAQDRVPPPGKGRTEPAPEREAAEEADDEAATPEDRAASSWSNNPWAHLGWIDYSAWNPEPAWNSGKGKGKGKAKGKGKGKGKSKDKVNTPMGKGKGCLLYTSPSPRD